MAVARVQMDNVIDKEGRTAVLPSNLRLHHPTVYWNLVVLAVSAKMDCPLDFLHIPGSDADGLRLTPRLLTEHKSFVAKPGLAL